MVEWMKSQVFDGVIYYGRCLAQPHRGSTTTTSHQHALTQAPCNPRPPIPPLSSLTTRAYHMHVFAHFTPQHWLLCHMGVY